MFGNYSLTQGKQRCQLSVKKSHAKNVYQLSIRKERILSEKLNLTRDTRFNRTNHIFGTTKKNRQLTSLTEIPNIHFTLLEPQNPSVYAFKCSLENKI